MTSRNPSDGSGFPAYACARHDESRRTCRRCGRPLRAGIRPEAVFCGDACRRAWHHERLRAAQAAIQVLRRIKDLCAEVLSKLDSAGNERKESGNGN